jgi:hypothetical protein
MHTTLEHTVSTVSSVRHQASRPGSNNLNLNRPMTPASTNIAPGWSAHARLSKPPSQPQTTLTVLTQTPPYESAAKEIDSGRIPISYLARIIHGGVGFWEVSGD